MKTTDAHGGARTRAMTMLLASLDPHGLSAERFQELVAKPIDWEWAFEQARLHKLSALFSARLSTWRTDPAVAPIAELLEREQQAAQVKAARAERTLRFLDEVARPRDLPFFVVKGSTLAEHIYGDLTHRSFNDVDVMVPQDRVDELEPILLDNKFYFWASPGYESMAPPRIRRRLLKGLEPGSKAAARKLLEVYHRHFTYVVQQDDPRLPLEVHWHLFTPGWGNATADDLWAETEEIDLCGRRVLALKPEAALLHTAVHAMEQHPEEFKLLHLCDVVWFLERSDRLDPNRLAALAKRWGLGSFVTRAIAAAENVFPFTLRRARDVWKERDPIRDWSLVRAGMNRPHVDQGHVSHKHRNLLSLLGREVLWDLSYNRPPGAAWTRVRNATQTFVKRTRQRVSGSPAETEMLGGD